MKLRKMSFILSTLIISSFSLAAMGSTSCIPEVIQTGREVVVEMAGTKVTGSMAFDEMSSKKLTLHKDSLGRLMYSDVSTLVQMIEGFSSNDAYPMARIERYCSKSSTNEAVCVDLCIRWTNFLDSRI